MDYRLHDDAAMDIPYVFGGGARWSVVERVEELRAWPTRLDIPGGKLLVHGTGAVTRLTIDGDWVTDASVFEGQAARDLLKEHALRPTTALRDRVQKALRPGRRVADAVAGLIPQERMRRWLPSSSDQPVLSFSWAGAVEIAAHEGEVTQHRWLSPEEALAAMEKWTRDTARP